jgi:hypothetical protein
LGLKLQELKGSGRGMGRSETGVDNAIKDLKEAFNRASQIEEK